MSLKQHIEDMPAVNLTSMIDVLFLLIIFFMVGTKFIETEREIQLTLPQVKPGDALTAAPEKKVINVYRAGQITLDHQTVSLEDLVQRLAAARTQYQALGVLVRGDGAAQFERVAHVLTACKHAGIADLSIAVEIANTDNNHARR